MVLRLVRRERVEVEGELEVVAAVRGRLVARVADPGDTSEVDASARLRLRVSIQEHYKTGLSARRLVGD